jgi:porin-like protein
MGFWIDNEQARSMLHTIGLVAASTILAIVFVFGAFAQTLTDPNPKPKMLSHQGTTNLLQTRHARTCATYGAGFDYVPGTDACLKIGGYVTVEGTAKGAR